MKPSITVVSLGPGSPELMTMQTVNALRKARRLILRTARHQAVTWLTENGLTYTSLDDYYDRYENFDAMHEAMASDLWREAEKVPVVFAVIDASSDGAVRALRASVPEEGKLTVYPGVTLADACLAQVPKDFSLNGSLRSMPAENVLDAAPDPGTPLLITELWSKVLACDIKLRLEDIYGEDLPVLLFPSTVKARRKPVKLSLWEIDRQHTYDHTVCLYIPAVDLMSRTRYCFKDLLDVMALLRQQCPWDAQQTHETLRKYLIEEAYEAVGAIDEGDMDHLADELGDVLLQIAFHADIGRTAYEFGIGDVTTAIVRKMIYRHAHIFGNVHCDTAEEVSVSWEQLKKKEKGLTSQASVLADVSHGLPALMRADKVQKKAAQVGFDWDTAIEALPKVREEADEVLAELKAGRDPGEELGDLLFSCVNVCRLAGKDPEEMLRSATEKFISRFTAMENLINLSGKSLEGLTLPEMDVYWNQVKCGRFNGV